MVRVAATAFVASTIVAMLPLSTNALWVFVGTPNVQFPGVNQLLVPCPTQTFCAYSAEDPIKKKFRLNITEHHLAHREPAGNRLENCTNGFHIKILRSIANICA